MIVLLVLLVLVLLLLAICYIAFFLVFVRLPVEPSPTKSRHLAPYAEEITAGGAWFRAQNPELVSIRSRDGLKLRGCFLPAKDARGTLLLVHGYRSSLWCDFGVVYEFFHSLGWNILAIHQRTHGESDGSYITFGIKERFDVCDWAIYLSDRFGPEHNIVMDGVSMGSSSVLMSLGTDLPGNVRGFIADCGFTSPYDQFVHMMKKRVHLPPQPFMAIIEMYTKLFAGFGFKDYSTVTALQQATIPVLFVHGENDNFVPTRFSIENYAACASEKRLVTVPGAGHGTSYLVEKERCQQTLREFLTQCEKQASAN